LVLFFSGLAAAGAAAVIALSCSDQPRIKCTAGRGAFAAKYTAMSVADAGCSIVAERLGVEAYNYPLPDKSNADLNRSSIAIKGDSIAIAIGNHNGNEDTTHKSISQGDFGSAEPGGDNFCNVPSVTPAQQDLALIDAEPPPADAGPDAEGTKEIPATSIKYEWSNVRFYVTPAAPGTQMVGDLTYTKDGCISTYHVTAVYPSVSCQVTDENGDGVFDDLGNPVLNPDLCLPEADPAHGRPTGSGINPDFPVECEPKTALCVLSGEVPAFKK